MTSSASTIVENGLSGCRPGAVIDALRQRLIRQRAGQDINDGKMIALVVEGGSMRGVYSAGGMLALAHLGYTNLFDRIYATSAGAMNASYFLSHQPDLGITVYFDSLVRRAFWNPWRFWKILDIDWLFDQVVTIDKPLDVSRVMSSTTRLFVTTMDRQGTAHVIDAQRSGLPLLTILKAAVAVPVFYNRCVSVEGRPCMDAGLVHAIPLEPAINDGCTDIMVLTTRSLGTDCRRPAWWSRMIFNLLSARSSSKMRSIYEDSDHRDRQVRSMAMGLADWSRNNHINIATFTPPDEKVTAWELSNSSTLRAAAKSYELMVDRAFQAGAGSSKDAVDSTQPLPLAQR